MSGRTLPRADPSAVLELLKPVTWFPPVWAFLCGALASGADWRWGPVALGLLLAGPMVCATSQAVNDWFDRHVDAINEPKRPIPSGRLPGRIGLHIAILWSLASLLVGATLGLPGLLATVLALVLAWAYSAPPLRLKANGWWGNLACGLSYETLPWITAGAVLLGTLPGWPVLVVGLLYGLGAHGIMTLNDFKSITGDRRTGVDSLPVLLGPGRAARVALAIMAAAQLAVTAVLAGLGLWLAAAIVLALLGAQGLLMPRFLADPRAGAIRYSAAGVGLYVLGMLAAALALRGLS
ncbi:MAG TPA: chlorophyll synthase ChlG [Roseococcus sp.]|nr:chlorophyll synthase ChlG [Roseococcus sp.]